MTASFPLIDPAALSAWQDAKREAQAAHSELKGIQERITASVQDLQQAHSKFETARTSLEELRTRSKPGLEYLEAQIAEAKAKNQSPARRSIFTVVGNFFLKLGSSRNAGALTDGPTVTDLESSSLEASRAQLVFRIVLAGS